MLQYVFFGRDRVLHGMLTTNVTLVTLCFRDINHSWELAHVVKALDSELALNFSMFQFLCA